MKSVVIFAISDWLAISSAIYSRIALFLCWKSQLFPAQSNWDTKTNNRSDFKATNQNIGKPEQFIHESHYYLLRSTVKREGFFARVMFSKETVSQTTASTGPMKMFRLEHETMNVCQRNVARFVHVECRFDKINDIFQGFDSFVSYE